MAIEARDIQSFTSQEHYQIYWLNGEVKGCSCKSRKYHPREDCKHMTEAKQRPSCVYCGQESKSGLCWRCSL